MSTLSNIADNLYNQLVSSDAGLECNYKPGYKAIATETDEGYRIDYYKTSEATPAFKSETFENANDCVREMVKVSAEWSEAEVEE